MRRDIRALSDGAPSSIASTKTLFRRLALIADCLRSPMNFASFVMVKNRLLQTHQASAGYVLSLEIVSLRTSGGVLGDPLDRTGFGFADYKDGHVSAGWLKAFGVVIIVVIDDDATKAKQAN